MTLNRKDLSLSLGNGDGTFQEASTYKTTDPPAWVVANDFDKDGKSDLLVSYATKLVLFYGPCSSLQP